MIKNGLNDILRKCSNSKFRNGYIMYIKSLDFNEFEKIFIYYASVIQTVMLRYINSSKFSKKWFKKYKLNYKFGKLYHIFFDANSTYLFEVSKNLAEVNSKREKILIDIDKNKKLLDNLLKEQIILIAPIDRNNLINFNVLIIDNIYLTNKLDNLIKELNILNSYPNYK